MVEQNAAHRVDASAPVRVAEPVSCHLRDAVGRGWPKRRHLMTAAVDVAEHVGARRLIHACVRSTPFHDLQKPCEAADVDVVRQLPACRHGCLAGEVVRFVGSRLLERHLEGGVVTHIASNKLESIGNRREPARESCVGTDEAVDPVAQTDQVLGQVAAVLTGDAGDQSGLHRQGPVPSVAAITTSPSSCSPMRPRARAGPRSARERRGAGGAPAACARPPGRKRAADGRAAP